VGEQLPGTVTGVAPFGLFVTLDSLYVEGLIHVSELGGEYFQHNDVIHELRGERTGRRFRLYDPLIVQISRVDLDARRIEFRLVPSMVRAVKRSRMVSDDDLSNEALMGGKGVRATSAASKSKPAQAKAAKAGKRTGRKRRG
jgi:ribonuclease R